MEYLEQIEYCKELIRCGCPLKQWVYSANGVLLSSDQTDPELFPLLFEESGSKDYLFSYAPTHKHPLLLSDNYGLSWLAVLDKRDDCLQMIHLLGPVFTAEGTEKRHDVILNRFGSTLPSKYKTQFSASIKNIPVISTTFFFQYAIMLHYAVTGERISVSEIHYQGQGMRDPSPSSTADRSRTWQVEQELLDMVRTGNLNFKNIQNTASLVSYGAKIVVSDSMRQVKDSVIIFISLCTRAAIEGGLSPENAYTLGDMYIQSVELCKTVSEAADISHTMYADFIQRVHKRREKESSLSHETKRCCDYIALHLTDDLNLDALAHSIGYSKYYLTRKFKEEIGIPVSRYILREKIERAKLLLRTTTLTIQEISEQLQFCSRTHLTDSFRKESGMTPTQYREENQIL